MVKKKETHTHTKTNHDNYSLSSFSFQQCNSPSTPEGRSRVVNLLGQFRVHLFLVEFKEKSMPENYTPR